jgi:hypothetical protein
MAADDPRDTPPGATTQVVADPEFETELEADGTRRFTLSGGRTLSVAPGAASDELVEFRSAAGLLELRVRLTPDGPVLQLEGVKVQLKAADAVSVDCKRFEVHASDGVAVKTEGTLELHSEQEARLSSPEDVRVVGKVIWLN